MKRLHKLDDSDLFRIFLHTKFKGLKRFIISLLQLRNSKILIEYEDLFTSDPATRIQVLRSLKKHADVVHELSNIQLVDIPFLIDSCLKTQQPIHLFQQPLTSFYEQNGRPLWLAATIFEVNGHSSQPKNSAITSSREIVPSTAFTKINTTGISMVREANLALKDLVVHLNNFCDQSIIALPNHDIIKAKQICEGMRVHFIDQPLKFNDSEIYRRLFKKGREIATTHFLRLDEDERLSPKITKEIFDAECKKIQLGHSATMQWTQIVNTGDIYSINFDELTKFSNFRNLQPYKDVIYCDDGKSLHREMSIHSSWIPEGFPKKRLFTPYELLHFEGLSLQNILNKYNKYLFWDFSVNHDIHLVYERYLPILFRLKCISHKKLARNFLSEINHTHKKLFSSYADQFKEVSISTNPEISIGVDDLTVNELIRDLVVENHYDL